MKSFCKKILKCLGLFLTTCFLVVGVATTPVYADEPAGDKNCNPFLGFVSWSCGVDIENINSTKKIGSTIWTIVANIATDLTVAAAYLVLGYVIYGGYLYMFAAGDPGKVATGKKTLSQAFIGLAIVMSASVILNSIRIALSINNGGSGVSLQGCLASNEKGDGFTSACIVTVGQANNMITNAIQWTIGIGGAVALIFVVYGAISYITSAGDAGKVLKARNTILYALIGLAIVALAETITAFVSSRISSSLSYLDPAPTRILLGEDELS